MAGTRRSKNVTIELAPFVVDGQGHPVAPASGQEPIGKRIWETYVVHNAGNNSQSAPSTIAWKSDGAVPNVDTANCLSRTQTQYDAAGRVWKNLGPNIDENEELICTQEIHYDAAGRQVEGIRIGS